MEPISNYVFQLKLERKAGDAALVAMTQNVAARLEVTKRKSEIPDSLFRQMTTCQTAANEFLRQFWLAIYPPPLEAPTASSNNPAQKAAKAAKMAGYLEKTHEKVEALVMTAQREGFDHSRVRVVSCYIGSIFPPVHYIILLGNETTPGCCRQSPCVLAHTKCFAKQS